MAYLAALAIAVGALTAAVAGFGQARCTETGRVGTAQHQLIERLVLEADLRRDVGAEVRVLVHAYRRVQFQLVGDRRHVLGVEARRTLTFEETTLGGDEEPPADAGTPDYQKARARRETANGELAEMESATRAGQLMETALVLAADRRRDGRTLIGDHEVDRLAALILRAGGK